MNKWHFKLSSRGRLAKVYGRRRNSNDHFLNNSSAGQELPHVADGVGHRESLEIPSTHVSVGSSNFPTSASRSCSTCPSHVSNLSEFSTNRRREAPRMSRCEAGYRDETRKLLRSSIANRKGTPPPCHRIGPICGCKDPATCVHALSLATETTSLSDSSLHIFTGYPSVGGVLIDKSSGSPNESVFYDAPQTPSRAAILTECGDSSVEEGSLDHDHGACSSVADDEADNIATGGTWGSLATVQCDAPLEMPDGIALKETRNNVHADLPVASIEDKEETILEILREIVRKCTNSDPSKRPTARDVLSMLSSLLNV